MNFEDVIGQSFLKKHLKQGVDSGRVPHAQLFIGKRGAGGLPMAIAYADYLIKQRSNGVGQMNPLTQHTLRLPGHHE